MIEILIALLIFLFIGIFLECIHVFVTGFYIIGKESKKFFDLKVGYDYYLINEELMGIHSGYISSSCAWLFSKYYIKSRNKYNRVLRFSKLHRVINKYYKEASSYKKNIYWYNIDSTYFN